MFFRIRADFIWFTKSPDSAKKIQYGGQTGHIEKGNQIF